MSSRQAQPFSQPIFSLFQLAAFLCLSSIATAKPLPYAAPAPLAAPWPQVQNSGSGYGDAPDGLNVAGGASGSDSSFNLSTGGLVAICVVVAIVVILGVASTVLFFVAKKRQWQVRRSVSRASRRVTARFTGKTVLSREEEERKARRHGAVRLAQGQSRSARETEKRRRTEMQKIRLAQINARNDSQSSAEEMTTFKEKQGLPLRSERVVGGVAPSAPAGGAERKVGVVLPPA